MTGPFRHWHHAHTFTPAPHPSGVEATLMTDVVDFAAPAGPLGVLADVLVLRRYMTRLILLRNAHIRQATETGQ